MAAFERSFYSERNPDIKYYLPLRDEEGNLHRTLEQASAALSEGKRLFTYIEIKTGESILRYTLRKSDFSLYSPEELIYPELLKLAEQMDPGESVIVRGHSIKCRDECVVVVGGYGKKKNGQPWVVTRTDTHEKPAAEIIEAMLAKMMICSHAAAQWRKLPAEGCGHREEHMNNPGIPDAF